MSFKKRASESIIFEGKPHWTSYIPSGISVVFFLWYSGVMFHKYAVRNEGDFWFYAGIALFLMSPMFVLKRMLINKYKHYIVTDQRVFICEGVLSRKVKEVSVQKINDCDFNQSFSERLMGTGTLKIMTGNDSDIVISGIDDMESFKEAILTKAPAAA